MFLPFSNRFFKKMESPLLGVSVGTEVKFLPEGKRVYVEKGTTILEAAWKAGADILALCGGRGFCGRCVVQVIQGEVSRLTESEHEKIKELGKKGFRLACQCKVDGDSAVIVVVPDQSRIRRQRLVIMGREPPMRLDPNVRKIYIELPPPSLHDPRGDDLRLLETLSQLVCQDLSFDYEVARKLPRILRESNWKVTVTFLRSGGRIINIQAGDTRDKNYGVAVDIGTTKLAIFLVNLNDGSVLFAEGSMNPQIKFGEDVMSRITYAMEDDEHLEEVHRAVIMEINRLIEEGLRETGICKEDLYELVAVGNTAMHHFFAGLNPKWTGLSPYSPVISKSFEVNARDLKVNINPAGNIHLLPNVAGFVGADAVADILASELCKREDIALLVDVGTNTEVMLGNRHEIWACSTASGPAFEGAHIKCGMRAASGAIERVRINEDFDVEYTVIGDEKPRGLCGSGIVDAVAEMLKVGIIDTSGRIVLGEHKRIRRDAEGRKEFVLVFKEESAHGEDIVVTQNDIREIQKAKAAIYAGCKILIMRSNIKKEDISEIMVAGAFGSYLDPASVRLIGMIPELKNVEISFLGNTAGSGARMCLKSMEKRREAEKIASIVKYVELAIDPSFMSEYISAMYLPHSRVEEFPETIRRIRAPIVSRARAGSYR